VPIENLGSSFGLLAFLMAPARMKKDRVLSAESRLSAPRNFRAPAATSASSEAEGDTGIGFPAGDGSTGVRSVLDEKRDDIGQAVVRAARHPLPWLNQPSGGENHVTDADGRSVYDGFNAAEMFRLYGVEAQAGRSGRSAETHVPVERRRTGWVRRWLRRTP